MYGVLFCAGQKDKNKFIAVTCVHNFCWKVHDSNRPQKFLGVEHNTYNAVARKNCSQTASVSLIKPQMTWSRNVPINETWYGHSLPLQSHNYTNDPLPISSISQSVKNRIWKNFYLFDSLFIFCKLFTSEHSSIDTAYGKTITTLKFAPFLFRFV